MVDDFDDFDELKDNLDEIDGENEIPMGELFDDGFMRKYTDFESIEEFFEQSPWTVESEEDLDAIPEGEMDNYVNEHTRFSNSDSMTKKAGEEWTVDQLGL